MSRPNKLFIVKPLEAMPLVQKMDVLFFKTNCPDLREYLAFLASIKTKRPYRFSFVDSEGSLIGAMSLRENLHLDSVPTMLSITKEHELSHLLKRLGNDALIELFNRISSWDLPSSQVNDRERKLAALLKGLLQESEYIFLNYPEKYLNDKELNLFKKALEFQMSTFGQIAFISGPNYEVWESFCSKIVGRNANHKFEVEFKTPAKACQSLEQTIGPIDASTDDQGHLYFYPAEEEKKAS